MASMLSSVSRDATKQITIAFFQIAPLLNRDASGGNRRSSKRLAGTATRWEGSSRSEGNNWGMTRLSKMPKSTVMKEAGKKGNFRASVFFQMISRARVLADTRI